VAAYRRVYDSRHLQADGQEPVYQLLYLHLYFAKAAGDLAFGWGCGVVVRGGVVVGAFVGLLTQKVVASSTRPSASQVRRGVPLRARTPAFVTSQYDSVPVKGR